MRDADKTIRLLRTALSIVDMGIRVNFICRGTNNSRYIIDMLLDIRTNVLQSNRRWDKKEIAYEHESIVIHVTDKSNQLRGIHGVFLIHHILYENKTDTDFRFDELIQMARYNNMKYLRGTIYDPDYRDRQQNPSYTNHPSKTVSSVTNL